MPPRFPHGLKKSPFDMNKGEKFVLGILGLSVGAGLLDMATSPWSVQDGSDVNEPLPLKDATTMTTKEDDTSKSKEEIKYTD
mmetsp:Transcript_9881/g.11560  ORF Transcript_9881/g.11560 Transcript_9881/m.11560 type:complete len:82 (-) Transcript_9881:351-596(-)|eukprot:CAMPEP_0198250694 /NCGR_PEP_ID=MMETSP1447-20131203/1776_1 /TAXON_ID=420782 /ORGANISM="Chaetoceros dichaeta, Strain CCMP1751" /LENGTH=81 /DNA_ID=CAMNT_0043935557 /DNA_START=86 /DNA_END=331 /DNA_ORIENTATION=+